MLKTIQDLKDARIESFNQTYDYWQIFLDTSIINIYNPFKILDNDGNSLQIDEKIQTKLVGLKIINIIDEPNKCIEFILNKNKKLVISIAKEDYSMPEALEINFKSGEFIVF